MPKHNLEVYQTSTLIPSTDRFNDCELLKHKLSIMGGDLGGPGGPQNLRWGTAHASVPQYFEK